MDFRILGPLQVLDEGRDVTLVGRKQRALLALLLLHANETLTIDRLIDELWGEEAPPGRSRPCKYESRGYAKCSQLLPTGASS